MFKVGDKVRIISAQDGIKRMWSHVGEVKEIVRVQKDCNWFVLKGIEIFVWYKDWLELAETEEDVYELDTSELFK